MARSMQVRVANRPQAVADARLAIAEALADWGLTGSSAEETVVADLLLITTELLSNAVKFSAGAVVLVLTWRGRTLRVTVTDTADLPARPRVAGPDSSGGRGLAIVDALSSRWGQTAFTDGSKEVWAEVAVAPRPGAGAPGSTATMVTVGG